MGRSPRCERKGELAIASHEKIIRWAGLSLIPELLNTKSTTSLQHQHLSGTGSLHQTASMSTSKPQDDVVANEAPLHFPVDDHLAHTKSMNKIIRDAKNASDVEHKMSLWQGIKLYPKAVGWSLLISTCIAMEGYDVSLLSNFCKFLWGKRIFNSVIVY